MTINSDTVRSAGAAVRLQLQELAGHDVPGLRVPVHGPAALCVRVGVAEDGRRGDDDHDDRDGQSAAAAASGLDAAAADRHGGRVLFRLAGVRVPGRRVREPRSRAVRDAVLRDRHRRHRVPDVRRVRPSRRLGRRRAHPVRPRVRRARARATGRFF